MKSREARAFSKIWLVTLSKFFVPWFQKVSKNKKSEKIPENAQEPRLNSASKQALKVDKLKLRCPRVRSYPGDQIWTFDLRRILSLARFGWLNPRISIWPHNRDWDRFEASKSTKKPRSLRAEKVNIRAKNVGKSNQNSNFICNTRH